MTIFRFVAAVSVLAALAGPMPAQFQGITGVGVSLEVLNLTAKTITNIRGESRTFYAAKFLCGTIPPTIVPPLPAFPGSGDLLVPGTYLTAINIQNQGFQTVSFFPFVAETKPLGQTVGARDSGPVVNVSPLDGVEIDCINILQILSPNITPAVARGRLETSFIKGFVTLLARPGHGDLRDLDATAVYTLKNVETGQAAVILPPG